MQRTIYIGYIHEGFRVRWWESNNPGDMFDLLTPAEFALRKQRAEAREFEVVDIEPEGVQEEMDAKYKRRTSFPLVDAKVYSGPAKVKGLPRGRSGNIAKRKGKANG